LLRLEKVTKVLQGNVLALKQVSFELQKGELAFLVGPGQVGKTTLLRLIAAEMEPTQGEIIFDGLSSRDRGAKKDALWRRKQGLVFDHPRLVDDMSVFDNVALGLRISGERESRIKRRVPQVLEQVGLLAKSRALSFHLSSGERQKVAIARAIVKNPILLLADEPTSDLDESDAQEIMDLLNEVNICGTTMLMTWRESVPGGLNPGRVIRIEKPGVA
jgi:cell division transport system ATP-binding protein